MIRQKFSGESETKTQPNGFGLDVQIRRPLSNPEHNPSGNPVNDGQTARGELDHPPFRNVIPRGEIGSVETMDKQLPPSQYVDTVQYYETEQNDPKLHGPMQAMRSADRGVTFNDYAVVGTPRRAPMPRAAQDDLYLEGPGKNAADPRMQGRDSSDTVFPGRRETTDNCDLYGDNVAGVLHNNSAHPGFAAVQSKIAKERGVSSERAGAILASSSRGASKAAHKANPRLNRVKG